MRVHYDARNGSILEGDSGVCVDPVRGLDKQLSFFRAMSRAFARSLKIGNPRCVQHRYDFLMTAVRKCG
jgi:hypothetical protein